MMDTGFDFSIIWSLFGAFVSFLVFGICIYFVIVKPCLESILMVIGSFVNLLTSLFYSIGIMLITKLYGYDFLSTKGIFMVVGGIGLLGSVCFTSGLIILIISHIRIIKKMKLEKY